MKWCFLLNQIDLFIEFSGKLSRSVLHGGDKVIVVANSKIAEYSKRRHFPKEVKIFSKVDWCIENYKAGQEEFGDLSWRELFPTFDRKTKKKLLAFTYRNSVEIVSQLYQFIDDVFRKEKPDVVISEIPANVFSEIAYYFCKKYGIRYLGLIGSRIRGRVDVYDLKYTCSKYEETFRGLDDEDITESERKFAQEFIVRFLSHKQLPSYESYETLSSFNRVKRYIKREKEMLPHWLRYISKRKYFKQFDYESEILLKYALRHPLSFIVGKLNIIFTKNIFDQPEDNEKYFLFPLHLQPEASTSVLATYFSDQVNSVKNAAFSLPFFYKLYVKAHPSAIGEDRKDFYRKLKQTPNVVLISPRENTENIIRKSQGVITLTSTIGMETALAGKPVYVLGNVFYSYHPLCRKVNNFEELKQKIQTDLIHTPSVSDLGSANIRFITSYLKNTVPGDISVASHRNDPNNYKAIYEDIKRMFLKYER